MEPNPSGAHPAATPTEPERQERPGPSDFVRDASHHYDPRRSASAISTGPDKHILANLKEQLALIGTLVVFVGIVSTEAYYRQFGMRYQFMSLPASHIVYRGLTAVAFGPYIVIPYAIASLAFALDEHLLTVSWGRLSRLRTVVAHTFVILLVAITYPLAHHVGVREAERDLTLETSQLPRVISLNYGDDPEITSADGYRVLFAGPDSIVVFVPSARHDAASVVPHMRIFSKGGLHELRTSH